ncbi:50S ribosomal protein L2 [Fervidicoccus fontis]|nr:50S ribosomal protein L2 [Fervidicoccus fontis]MBE9391123.1 50S ribosomal protein L2 [Fervidicoccus fontis]PMB75735.1 MAG: 50S ribosomal protein L2 [Fervidicoccus fontis]PMB78121.1 MAG: 50S ribosomal protein L2 [Fervidicoccus fontis]HEW64187.1 50S ribosomal protein L2 [Fervidicoccus fontis]
MGKKIRQQRAGRGSPTFRSRKHLHEAPAAYPAIKEDETFKGHIVEIIHDPGRWVPLAKVKLENGVEFYTIASEGSYIGQEIEIGPNAKPVNGNILPLQSIPEGTQVFNIEIKPMDGGKLVRTGGGYAQIISKGVNTVTVVLPSGKSKEIDGRSRATIGVAAGGGRIEKPLLKAGNSYWKWKPKARKYPKVRGVAMNVVSHPFGGGHHQSESKPTTVSRNAPPGRKVGHIAARRTGRRKGKVQQ